MLNLANIPNNEISGLGTNDLEWVTAESNCRYVQEISDDFIRYLNDEEDDLSVEEVSEEMKKQMDSLELEGIPPSTLKQTNDNVTRFVNFLNDKHLSTDLCRIPVNILNDYLRYFYSQLRTRDGRFYAPATLICIRAALHRHFLSIRTDVNIIGDSKFIKSNKMLITMI